MPLKKRVKLKKKASHFFFFFFFQFFSTSIQSTFYIGRESKYWTITNEKSFLSEKPVTFHEMTKLFCESWSISPLLFAITTAAAKQSKNIVFDGKLLLKTENLS